MHGVTISSDYFIIAGGFQIGKISSEQCKLTDDKVQCSYVKPAIPDSSKL